MFLTRSLTNCSKNSYCRQSTRNTFNRVKLTTGILLKKLRNIRKKAGRRNRKWIPKRRIFWMKISTIRSSLWLESLMMKRDKGFLQMKKTEKEKRIVPVAKENHTNVKSLNARFLGFAQCVCWVIDLKLPSNIILQSLETWI